ncbi:sensor domain-containing protein [Rhodococcus sp. ARC_M6]|uniref:sensor domain-containing protein n=1 Tax=Rhodococcus sp. ARC_M6 TaxID=2928852 RepID=UPI001FB20CA3|nr:sensor domain-containing protein [Rhodococcus sp. ARC_M6]MCJ0903737.1 sensor domain-containing protein [Rhodococcus sp. ARC_M6]
MARRIALGLGVAAVLVVSGCGSDTAEPSSAIASAVPEVSLVPFTPAESGDLSGTPLDKETLQRTVLTLSDLPADFDIVPDPVEDLGLAPAPSTSDSDKSTTDPAACAAVLAPISTQIPGSVASITKTFAGPDFTSIDQDSASFTDGATAATAFRTMQDILAGCAEYSGTDADGTTVSYRVGAGHQPSVGDASFSYRIITTSEGFTLVADVVVAAVGTTLTQLSATAPTPIAPDVLGSMAVTAAQRLIVPTP